MSNCFLHNCVIQICEDQKLNIHFLNAEIYNPAGADFIHTQTETNFLCLRPTVLQKHKNNLTNTITMP